MNDQQLIEFLRETIASLKRGHYYCEDSWFSCPKDPEGCANNSAGTDCNCGADKWNARIDHALSLSFASASS